MTITEEITSLMKDLKKSVDVNGNVDLSSLLTEVVTLFDHLKSALPRTNPQERSDIVDKMTELHTFLLKESKRLALQTGISEEQMARFAENPDNFTKEQWNLLENVKSIMSTQSHEIKKVMQEFYPKPVSEVKAGANKGKEKKRKNREIKKA